MRKFAVAGLALPVLGFVYLSAFLRRSILARLALLVLGVLLVVSGLIVGLPTKPTQAHDPTTFAPLSPASFTVHVQNNLPLDSTVNVEFTKPMNEESVAAAAVTEPKANIELTWSTDDKSVSIKAAPYWEPATFYTIDVPGSVLGRDGQALGQPIHIAFVSGVQTAGTITATAMSGDHVAATSAFVVTFDRPVPLAQVAAHWRIEPKLEGSLTGDDYTDANSQVFTFTPFNPLPADTAITVGLDPGTLDKHGVEVAAVEPLEVATGVGPGVVRFRPADKTTDAPASQAVSVRFTQAMDTAATSAAFVVTADGKAVTGTAEWAEGDTVLVLTPKTSFSAGAKVVMTVTTAANSKEGVVLAKDATSSFTVAKPVPKPATVTTPKKTTTPTTTVPISSGGIAPVGGAPWYAYETYYLQLMNCTRTGGWVTSSGSCSLGANRYGRTYAIALDAGISNKVARPYAKYMADNNTPTHFAYGTPGTRLAAQGYTSYHWAENIGWPGGGMSGMVSLELFYQSEASYSGGHFVNLMNPEYDRCGIGVWVERGLSYTVIDFYHP